MDPPFAPSRGHGTFRREDCQVQVAGSGDERTDDGVANIVAGESIYQALVGLQKREVLLQLWPRLLGLAEVPRGQGRRRVGLADVPVDAGAIDGDSKVGELSLDEDPHRRGGAEQLE